MKVTIELNLNLDGLSEGEIKDLVYSTIFDLMDDSCLPYSLESDALIENKKGE